MDIAKYVKAVARIVNDELNRENIAVANAAQKSGIPCTTLMRRLEHPDLYPFTIAELAQISDVLAVNLSTVIAPALGATYELVAIAVTTCSAIHASASRRRSRPLFLVLRPLGLR